MPVGHQHRNPLTAESSSVLQSVIDSQEETVFSVDREYRYTSFNKKHRSTMKASFGVDVCIGQCMLDDLAAPEDRAKARANLDLVFSSGQKLVVEASIGDPSLLRRHSRITHSPIFGDDGVVTGVVVLSRDITQQKMLEQKSEVTELEFKTLFMLGPDAFYVASMHDGKIIEVNPGFETVFGYTREEAIGKTSRELNLWADYAARKQMVDELETNGQSRLEIVIRRKNGELRDCMISTRSFTNGDTKCIVGIVRDITGRKRAEMAIRESEQRYRQMFEQSPLAINITRSGKILYANPAYLKMFGYESADEINRSAGLEMFTPECRPQIVENIRRRAAGLPVPDSYEAEVFRKDGSRVPIFMYLSAAQFSDGPAVIAFIVDITDPKRSEHALRDSQEKYRTLVENASEAIVVAQDGLLRFVNARAATLSGYSKREMLSMGLEGLIHPDDRSTVMDRHLRRLAGETPSPSYEFRIACKDGSARWVNINAVRIVWEGRPATLNFFVDVSERRAAEEALRESEAKYRLIAENTADVIWVLDLTSKRFKYVSPSVFKLRGYTPEEVMAQPMSASMTPESLRLVEGRLTADLPLFLRGQRPAVTLSEVDQPCKDGSIVHTEVLTAAYLSKAGQPEIVGVSRDVTERRRLQERLLVTDRLASIGELASGMAHELNNPLTSVIGFSELLLEEKIPEGVRADVQFIHSEAQRTAEIIRNMLTFARKHPAVKQPINLNDVLRKVLELRAYEHKISNIETSLRLADDLPEIQADYFQLQQVFLNIVINAEYFMKEIHGQGALKIVSERADNKVRVSIADDGPGIAPENIGRLFDPFFTTKEVGKGTGLGLSICHGIVMEHGGKIYAESEPGKGATFVVELPVG